MTTQIESPSIPPSDLRWIAYAPTLRSPGGFRALQTRFEDRIAFLEAAIVAEPARFALCFPSYHGPIHAVSGHLDGIRALRRCFQERAPIAVIALQNPVLPSTRFSETLFQNNLYASPRMLFSVAEGPGALSRYLIATVVSYLQVARSDRTVVLNPSYPRAFDLLSDVTVRPNRLAATALRARAKEERLRTIAFVGSFHKFRGLHLLLEAFLSSGIAAAGWRLLIHAGSGDRRYQERCQRVASSCTSVVFAAADLDPQVTLAEAALAVFPSQIEGASIAFLEALHLSRRIIALDRPHFRSLTEREGASSDIMWIPSWDVGAWADALNRSATALEASLSR